MWSSQTSSNSEDKPSSFGHDLMAGRFLQGTAVGIEIQSVRLCGPFPPATRQGAKQPCSAHAVDPASFAAMWPTWFLSMPCQALCIVDRQLTPLPISPGLTNLAVSGRMPDMWVSPSRTTVPEKKLGLKGTGEETAMLGVMRGLQPWTPFDRDEC
jgi:hypothetical protein